MKPRTPRPHTKPGFKRDAPRPQRFNKQRPPQRTDWNPVANWYDELVGDWGSEYHREVVLPGTIRLLGLGPGDTAIDIAAGQGVLCRMLHDRRVKVTGVDSATELIRIATQRSDPAIQYAVADARDLSRLPGAGTYTAAACILAIQNIDPIHPVFEGVARLLADRGRFVLAMMHPAFRVPKQAHWGWDEQSKTQFRRIDRYLTPFKEKIVTHPGKDPFLHTWSFHRPIQTYVRALRQAGFLVDALEEWPSHKTSTSGPRADAENIARREIPMFLAIRAVKSTGTKSSSSPL